MLAWIDRLLIRLAKPALAREQLRLGKQIKYRTCAITGCNAMSIHNIRWGKHGSQQCGNFCEKHCRELWDECHAQVAVGVCFWTQGFPE